MATASPHAQSGSSPGAALLGSIPPAQTLLTVVSLPAVHLSCGHTGKAKTQVQSWLLLFLLSWHLRAGWALPAGEFSFKAPSQQPQHPRIAAQMTSWLGPDGCVQENWQSKLMQKYKKSEEKYSRLPQLAFQSINTCLMHPWTCQEGCKGDVNDPGQKNMVVETELCSQQAHQKLVAELGGFKVSSDFSIYLPQHMQNWISSCSWHPSRVGCFAIPDAAVTATTSFYYTDAAGYSSRVQQGWLLPPLTVFTIPPSTSGNNFKQDLWVPGDHCTTLHRFLEAQRLF